MNERFESVTNELDTLELGLQELEAMEAPGWWTTGGVVVGISIVSIVAT
jgi:hypothetical protein